MKSRFIWLLFIAGAFFSCKKKSGNIVIDGQGEGAVYGVIQTDTLTLLTSTVLEDSLPANSLAYSLIGSMSDPLLGKTTASAYATALLYEPSSDFPNTEEPDSAVLFIPIIDGLNFYGNKSSQQVWDIYPLNSIIDGSKVYYQGYSPVIDGSMKTTFVGPIYKTRYDSVNYKKTKLNFHPGLRIKLSSAVAKKLMQMPKEAYQSDENLNKYFPGIAVVPQDVDQPAGKGGIGVFSFAGSTVLGDRANIFLYYRDTQTFAFTFSGTNRTITKGNTGPYPAAVQQQLLNPKKSYNTTYVQSLQGVKTHIQIPYLLNLTVSENVAINKAEIVFYIDKTQINSDFPAPPRLNLFRPAYPNSLRNFLLRDAGNSTFGGVYNEAKGTYTFIITRHIQDMMNSWHLDGKNENYGLFLTVPTGEPVLAARTAIDHTKTKLRITYTKLN
ncbi:MAG: DUF4270 family protein [Bacteroidia bacterium]|nr:DUF4270 family protein [Bacteroidia bacterium]